jgi:hypothetical protein
MDSRALLLVAGRVHGTRGRLQWRAIREWAWPFALHTYIPIVATLVSTGGRVIPAGVHAGQ